MTCQACDGVGWFYDYAKKARPCWSCRARLIPTPVSCPVGSGCRMRRLPDKVLDAEPLPGPPSVWSVRMTGKPLVTGNPQQTHDPNRRCTDCKKSMSRYNKGDRCYRCSDAKAAKKAGTAARTVER